MTKFSDLGLAETLLRALEHEGYETPTPIQAQAIPSLLQGRDLLGIAQTGTGKTAAFALPILQRLLTDRRRPAPRTTRALVLAPTRELAAQIADSFRAYGQFIPCPPLASSSAASRTGRSSTCWRAVSTCSSLRRAGCSTIWALAS